MTDEQTDKRLCVSLSVDIPLPPLLLVHACVCAGRLFVCLSACMSEVQLVACVCRRSMQSLVS